MITSPRQIVWTPIITQRSVAVALDPTFAKACQAYVLDEQKQKLAHQVWKIMVNKRPMTPGNFLDFHEGLLLAGIYYKPGDGIWMELDLATLSSAVSPVIYHGHNADLYAGDRLWLLHAFGAWAEAACVLLNWD